MILDVLPMYAACSRCRNDNGTLWRKRCAALPSQPRTTRSDWQPASGRLKRTFAKTTSRLPSASSIHYGKRGRSRLSWLGVIPLRLAQIRFRRGDIDGALELLESLARTCPNFCQQHEADFLCGCCYAAQGKLPAARTAFGRAIRSPRGATTETAAWAQWMIADTHQQEENYQQAIREFLRVSVLYDEFPQWQASALIHAGRCFERLGDERSAAKTYAQLRERFGGTGLANAADARRKSLRIQKPQCVATSDSAVTVLVSKQPG